MNDSTSINRTISDETTAKPSSQLFTVRIWPELSDQGVAWRGKVQHVPNGAWRYFQDGAGLIAFLQSQVEEFVRTYANWERRHPCRQPARCRRSQRTA